MATKDVILTPTARGCWCRSARQKLTGATIQARPDMHSSASVLLVTGVKHGRGGCYLRLDGGLMWLMKSADGTIALTTTDEQADVWRRLARPVERNGTIGLHEAVAAVKEWLYSIRYARQLYPEQTDRLLRGHPEPTTPPVASSSYTRGRVRLLPDGQWVAEIGFAGTLRTIGQYPTLDEARNVVVEAITSARADLEEWMRRHIDGDWTITWPPMEIAVPEDEDPLRRTQDRLTAALPEHADLIEALARIGRARADEDELIRQALELGVDVLGDLDIATLTGRDRSGIHRRRTKGQGK